MRRSWPVSSENGVTATSIRTALTQRTVLASRTRNDISPAVNVSAPRRVHGPRSIIRLLTPAKIQNGSAAAALGSIILYGMSAAAITTAGYIRNGASRPSECRSRDTTHSIYITVTIIFTAGCSRCTAVLPAASCSSEYISFNLLRISAISCLSFSV